MNEYDNQPHLPYTDTIRVEELKEHPRVRAERMAERAAEDARDGRLGGNIIDQTGGTLEELRADMWANERSSDDNRELWGR